MIVREIKQSTLDNYINGNYSDLTNEEKILCASYSNSLTINVVDNVCPVCGDDMDYCDCESKLLDIDFFKG